MTATPTTASDYDAIAETVQRYVDGAGPAGPPT
jgi:hypothetical protein